VDPLDLAESELDNLVGEARIWRMKYKLQFHAGPGGDLLDRLQTAEDRILALRKRVGVWPWFDDNDGGGGDDDDMNICILIIIV
jgi:hypothetical protein